MARWLRTSAIDCGSWPPVAADGIDDAADAEGAVDERGDGARADVGGDAGADAVGGLDVVLAGGQGGAFAGVSAAVAEEDFGGAVGLIEGGEDGGRRLLLDRGSGLPSSRRRWRGPAECWRGRWG